MAALPNNEDAVRRRMRRQQFANTLAILVFALAIVVVAAWFVERGRLLHRPAPPLVRHEPKPMAPRARPAVTAPPTHVAAPASVAQAMVPAQKPAASQPITEKTRATTPQPSAKAMQPAPAAAAPLPQVETQPAASPTSRSPYEMPGATGATRVLVGIKCVDDLRYEGEARGRRYFSARCESGARRTVSCIGGGCKIEYAPPPSHMP